MGGEREVAGDRLPTYLTRFVGRSQELAGHVRGAVRNGCTEQEVQEALLQTLGYCGAPAALEAFRVAERVLAELQEQGLGEQ